MIEGLFHVTETDSKKFTATIIAAVHELQKNKLKVEIQYSTSVKGTIAPVVEYSALITGRLKK